ncbi:unnamed protein product [Ostreobium quekettii]|uniref:Uncharacterized protein n=1 Tax=Ostreobium quekettii TaxID=121088 RepID=A0A8S1JF31_9CHLO|nr:unnamed protein product [Ostreobium quekettii]
MATSSGGQLGDSERVRPVALGRLLAADLGRVQTWKMSGWKSGKREDVFLLRRVDLWWILAQPGKSCPTDAGAWRKGHHIGLVRGRTVVDFSNEEAGEWFVKVGDDCQYFKAKSASEAALWVASLKQRVQPWNDELRDQTAGELVGDAGERDNVTGHIHLSHLTAAQEMVTALSAAASFTKDVLGTLPIAGPALSLLGFALEAVSREAADVESIRPARALLEEVTRRTMETLHRAVKLNDEDYKREIFKVLEKIETAARMLERHGYRSTAGRFKHAILKRDTGPLAAVDLLKQCKDDLSKLQIHQLAMLQMTGLENPNALVANQPKLPSEDSFARRKLLHTHIPIAPDAVALEGQLCAVTNMLLENKTKYVVVWGMGGIGKTTLAHALINDNRIVASFKKRVFVTIAQNPNITRCQKQIWNAVMDSEHDVQFTNAEDGKWRLRTALKDEAVFVVLDDVWDKGFVAHFDVVSAKSRVLITSRSGDVATSVEARRYAAVGLGEVDSMRLFCKKAFATGQPLRWQSLYVKDIVQECGGLPLALEVMGAEARGYSSGVKGESGPTPKEKRKWERAVERMKTTGAVGEGLFGKVFAMSFDSLEELHQMALLDLAMLPEDHEARESDVVDMQCCNGLSADEAYDVLEEMEQRSLIIRTGEDALSVREFQSRGFVTCRLHDVVRDSAMKLITDQPVAERCRLVSSHLKKELHVKDQRLLVTKFSATHSIGQDSDLDLQTLKVPQLRALVLRNAELSGLPLSLLAANLVVIDLAFSGVASLPPEVACLEHAKVLRLDGCVELEHLPNEVGAMQQLWVLSLRGCQGIYELPESLVKLTNLRKLLMPECGIAQILSIEIGSLPNLEVLDLSGCAGLKCLPPSLGDLSGLTALHLGHCWQLTSLPSTIGKLSNLEVLLLHRCTGLEELPSAVTFLHKLAELDVQGCRKLKCLPQGFVRGCPGLKILRLQGNSQLAFPHFALELQQLHVLGIYEDWMLPSSATKKILDQQVWLEKEATKDYTWREKDMDTPLHWAAGRGKMEMVEYHLRETNVDASGSYGDTALIRAACDGHAATVELLLNRGASVDAANQYGSTALIGAARIGHAATVELLLNRGASVDAANQYGDTALIGAARIGHAATVELLLNRGASVDAANQYGDTALIRAAGSGHAATVELLLNRGASVDVANQYGRTALIRAAANGHAATVELLLNRGASVDATDQHGCTSLQWAAAGGSEAVFDLVFAKYDAPPLEAKDKDGDTPLLEACISGHSVIVERLLDRGANVHAVNNEGKTPLICAAVEGTCEIVKLLLDHGARADIEDKSGRGPAAYAREEGHAALAEMLEAAEIKQAQIGRGDAAERPEGE